MPHGNNGDSPRWARTLSSDMRAFMREAAEDRKRSAEQFAEYSRRAEEDRRQAAERHSEFIATLEMLVRVSEKIADGQRHQTRILGEHTRILHENTRILHRIVQLLHVQGNGRGGNGRGGNGRR